MKTTHSTPGQNRQLLSAICLRSMAGLALAALSGIATAAPRVTCLPYEPAVTAVSGQLVRKTFAGPPNYESIKDGDRPETGFYLTLSKPVCAVETGGRDNNDALQGVTLIQLILNQQGYQQLRPMLGKTIELKGTLSSAFTGHHHAPLLLQVTGLESVPEVVGGGSKQLRVAFFDYTAGGGKLSFKQLRSSGYQHPCWETGFVEIEGIETAYIDKPPSVLDKALLLQAVKGDAAAAEQFRQALKKADLNGAYAFVPDSSGRFGVLHGIGYQTTA